MSAAESVDPAVQAALEALAAGISVLPIVLDGTKSPAVVKWGHWQQKPMGEDEARHRFCGRAIGIIGGRVSGGLEIIDIETRDGLDKGRRAAEEMGVGNIFDRVVAGYTVRTTRGWHVAFRSDSSEPARKLAHCDVTRCQHEPRHEGTKNLLVETRGEGSYAVAPGSPASVHESGVLYEFVDGGFDSIVSLTIEEREALLAVFRSLDQSPVEDAPPSRQSSGALYDSLRPGEDFVSRASWDDILVPHGWTRLRTNGAGVTHWRRPGKRIGVSATTNARGGDYLYVHTTSTIFEVRGYNKFSAYALLEHNGDFSLAAEALRARGYGMATVLGMDGREIAQGLLRAAAEKRDEAELEPEHVEAVEEPEPETEGDVGDFPAELYDTIGGQLGVLWRHLVETAPSPQPELALGAALVALGTVVGRKVRTQSGLRSNLYVLAHAPTGGGKEHARKIIKDLFHEVGAFKRVANDKLASDAAIWSAVADCQSSLFMIDEASRLLARLNAKNAPAHIEAQVDAYLSLYSQADQIAVSKTYADLSKRTEIIQPCLSLYMTTTPDPLFEAMSGAHVEDGFLARFLVFGSTSRPVPRDVEPTPLPESVVACWRAWETFEPPSEQTLFATPNPIVVPADDAAKEVLRDFALRMHARSATSALFSRATVQAQKVALIAACGAHHEPVITEPIAAWSCQLVEYLLARFAAQLEERSGRTERERWLKEVARFFRERREVTAREYTRRFGRLDRRLRDELVADLVDAGRVEVLESKTRGSRGPAPKLVRWRVS